MKKLTSLLMVAAIALALGNYVNAQTHITATNPSSATNSKAGVIMKTGGGWEVKLQTSKGNNWLELADKSNNVKHYWKDRDYYATGKVGIGTSNIGSYRLAVNGSIRAKEVVVESGWADFVFEPDYKLRSINEVENFIQENGHLPDVPSAQEVAESGVSLGESQTILLQKIEELTLYVIQLQNQNNTLTDRIETLEGNIE